MKDINSTPEWVAREVMQELESNSDIAAGSFIEIRRCHCGRAHPALEECSHHICGTCGEWHSKDLKCEPAPEVVWMLFGVVVSVIGFGWLILHMWGTA